MRLIYNYNFISYLPILILFIAVISCDREVSTTELDNQIHTGKIILNSTPPSAYIYLNGDNTGKYTPDSILFLESGDYHVVLRKELFLDTSFTVKLENDITEYIYVNYYEDARNYGTIECLTDPPDCEIYINDSLTEQKTPYIFDFIWPDHYEIKYSYPVHRTDSIRITVHAQDTSFAYLELQDTTYAVDYSNNNSEFPTGLCWAVAVDENDLKWIETRGKGLVTYDDKNWTIYNVQNSILPSDFINCITIDKRNRKWIGTLNGLVLIDENGTWRLFNTDNSSLPNNYITEIKEDSKGIIWIGASEPTGAKALSKYDGISLTNYEVDKLITAMTIDKEDRIWIGLDDKIQVFDGNMWVPELTDTMRTQGKLIDALACDQRGRILFGIRTKYVNDPTA